MAQDNTNTYLVGAVVLAAAGFLYFQSKSTPPPAPIIIQPQPTPLPQNQQNNGESGSDTISGYLDVIEQGWELFDDILGG